MCQLYRRFPLLTERQLGEGHAGWISASTFPLSRCPCSVKQPVQLYLTALFPSLVLSRCSQMSWEVSYLTSLPGGKRCLLVPSISQSLSSPIYLQSLPSPGLGNSPVCLLTIYNRRLGVQRRVVTSSRPHRRKGAQRKQGRVREGMAKMLQ